jgi:decaprenyl-phosphate phosphoribosyltransferase
MTDQPMRESVPEAPVPADPATELPKRNILTAAVRGLRPRQWTKNVLVFSAPLAAGALFRPDVLVQTLLAFVSFCLVSGAVYLINDIRDIEEDRQHPKKRSRPIAAGDLPVPTAWVLALVVGGGGLVLGYLVAIGLGVTVTVYLLLQLGYSIFLKHQPVIDLAMVSSGFLLRAIAGGVASGIVLSQWFLLVASFGSLFMVAGKRYSELLELGADAGTRRSLASYTPSYLRFVWILSAALVLISYSLWAFENLGRGPLGVGWTAISIAPFALGLLQYAREIDQGGAGEPEDIVLADRVLQVFGLIWLIVICIAVFG